MAILQIPTSPDTPFYSQTSQLEGVDYGFVFVYNQRENTYYLSIETVAGEPLVKGVKLVCNIPLLAPFTSDQLPPGVLFVVSSDSANNSPPGIGELGARCQLMYATSDDPQAASLV